MNDSLYDSSKHRKAKVWAFIGTNIALCHLKFFLEPMAKTGVDEKIGSSLCYCMCSSLETPFLNSWWHWRIRCLSRKDLDTLVSLLISCERDASTSTKIGAYKNYGIRFVLGDNTPESNCTACSISTAAIVAMVGHFLPNTSVASCCSRSPFSSCGLTGSEIPGSSFLMLVPAIIGLGWSGPVEPRCSFGQDLPQVSSGGSFGRREFVLADRIDVEYSSFCGAADSHMSKISVKAQTYQQAQDVTKR